MRFPVYAWGDGERIHLWARAENDDGVTAFDPVHGGMVESTESQREATWAYPDFAGGIAMPMDVWDELVVMRYAELERQPARLAQIRRQAGDNNDRNPTNLHQREEQLRCPIQ